MRLPVFGWIKGCREAAPNLILDLFEMFHHLPAQPLSTIMKFVLRNTGGDVLDVDIIQYSEGQDGSVKITVKSRPMVCDSQEGDWG